jgi:hypothetical protein
MQVLRRKSKNRSTKMSKIRKYSELRRLRTFEERYDYLALRDRVGRRTYGFDRWLNQEFYHSRDRRSARDEVILRDNGCDLGILGYEIQSGLLIHHMNPMIESDIINGEEWIIDPEYLITTTHRTHNAIHYGDRSLLSKPFVERTAGDTRLWTRQPRRRLYER